MLPISTQKPIRKNFYSQHRELKTHIVSQITKEANNDTTENDPYELYPLSVSELKTDLRLRALPTSGSKSQLIQRLTKHIDNMSEKKY